jgi:hypothetical protein
MGPGSERPVEVVEEVVRPSGWWRVWMWPVRLGAVAGIGEGGGAGRGGGAVVGLVEGLDAAGEAGAVAGIGAGWGAGRGRGAVVGLVEGLDVAGEAGGRGRDRGGRWSWSGRGRDRWGLGAVRGGGAAGGLDAWPERAGGAVAGIGEAVEPVEEVVPSSGWSRVWMRPVRRGAVAGIGEAWGRGRDR